MGKFNKTKDWLIEQYVIKNRTRKEIALECGLSESGLKSLLIKLDIKKETLDLPKEKLEELVNLKLNHKEIEEKLNISQTTLYRYLKKYNLSIIAEPDYNQYDDSKDTIICQLYLDGFSTTEIGEELGMSHTAVSTHLEHCRINRRTFSEAQWAHSNKTIPDEFKSYEKMYDLYINQRLSKKDLGQLFNCDPCVIDRVLTELNIPIRNNSESKLGLISGDKHWNWKGGLTSLSRRLREFFGTNLTVKILERDNYKCRICGSKHNLQVHHIIHFKDIVSRILNENPQYSLPDNINELYNIAIKDPQFLDCDNLITYCRDCHHKIHGYNSMADNKSCELLED